MAIDLNEMRRLAGIGGELGTFDDGLEESVARGRGDSRQDGVRRVLQRTRPLDERAEMVAFSSDSWDTRRTATSALFGVHKAIEEIETLLDEMGHSGESYDDDIVKVRDGALTTLWELTKTAGYALDGSFTRDYHYDRDRGDSYCYGRSLPASVMRLLGEIAKAKAILKECDASKLGGYDAKPATVEKALKAFTDGCDDKFGKLRTGLQNLAATIAKSAL